MEQDGANTSHMITAVFSKDTWKLDFNLSYLETLMENDIN